MSDSRMDELLSGLAEITPIKITHSLPMKDSDATENNSNKPNSESYEEVVDNSTCSHSNVEAAEESAECNSTAVDAAKPQESEKQEDGNVEVHCAESSVNALNANVSTSESPVDGFPVSDSKRKFRVLGLNYPGKWMESQTFLDLLHKSETFHLWFEKASEGKVKPGGASIVFESVAEAKNAFATVQKMEIDGRSLKLQASKLFYEDAVSSEDLQQPEKVTYPFDVVSTPSDTTYRLYAVHLHSSTKQDFLTSVFDTEYVKSIKLANDPYVPSEMQAEIVFSSKEDADTVQSELAELEVEEIDRMV
ncbi:unnamed protein product [Enterobius vermicularis]|uniref:RRM domain-containing protein n=1 Tax=Enterobius vermicularis TaxID=51028 RepID=A0A0N4V3R7_ENTVE|nr:unnamed protein product [Enterobius vermicularis]